MSRAANPTRAALLAWLVLLVLLVPAATTPAASVGSEGSPRVEEHPLRGGEYLTAVIPGTLISYTVARTANGGRAVFLLSKPYRPPASEAKKEDTGAAESAEAGRRVPRCPAGEAPAVAAGNPPTRLYRFDLAKRVVAGIREDLPHDASAIEAVDVDGDGRDELVLARPGQLLALPLESDAPLTPLLDVEGFRWSALHPRSIRRPSGTARPWVSTTGLGVLTIYGPPRSGEPWRERVRVELPLEAEVDETRARVWSPEPGPIGESSDGSYYFATSPDDSSRSRVHTTLVRASETGESGVVDCWASLPEPEEVLGSDFLMLDDRPVLLVTTKPADKLNLFGEQRLRLYPLRRDRSRLGLPPLFATETRMNLWQEGSPMLLDVNGDGRVDLVLGYWKGMLKDRVVLDAYIRQRDGSFERSPQTTAFDVSRGDRSFVQYGKDLDGDGLPDLLIRGKPGLLVYRGRPSHTGKNLVHERPRVLGVFGNKKLKETDGSRFYMPTNHALPRVVDLDGDGVHEILVLDRGSSQQRSLFHVLRVEG